MNERENTIYLDYNATTLMLKEVFDEMAPCFMTHYGNPSSGHALGEWAAKALERARGQVAELINADRDEIYFTGGATESNNLALRGGLPNSETEEVHLLTSTIEHPSVAEVVRHLGQELKCCAVDYVPVDDKGRVAIHELKRLIRPTTRLISLMTANNTIGTVQDIETIGRLANDRGILFHTDATQAVGKLNIDVKAAKIGLLSMSGHKIYGPKGVGALYIDRKVAFRPRFHGGGQERNIRPGTENLPGIVAFGQACRLAAERREDFHRTMLRLRERFLAELKTRLSGYRLLSDPEYTLPSTVNVAFENIRGEAIVQMMNHFGIYVSTCSACNTNHASPDELCPPLKALGLPDELIRGAVRFSFGIMTTEKDLETCVAVLQTVVAKLRQLAA